MSPLQLVETLELVLAVLVYLLFLLVASLAIILGITVGMGVLGAVLSAPLLSLLPDVRRFLAAATGGGPDDETPAWRVAVRLRYLLLSALFGLGYGVVFLVLFAPIREYDVAHPEVELASLVVWIPVLFVVCAVPVVTAIHRRSRAWTTETSLRSVLLQWTVFLGVVVGLGTGIPVLATGFGLGAPGFPAW